MSDRSVDIDGPLAGLSEGFRAELRRLGYKPDAASHQLELLGELGQWLEETGVAAGELTGERVGAFVDARRSQGRRRYISRSGTAVLLGYLRRSGVVPSATRPAAVGPTEVLLERYYRFLVDDRGLADAVVAQYEVGAALFMTYVAERNLELAEVSANDVSSYVAERCARPVKFAPRDLAPVLRSFLRFLYVEGLTSLPLAQAVPPVPSWAAASLPKALSPDVPKRLLDSCDRRTAHGRRDYAMLMLLARLGLRAGEVVALRLEDFDWRAGEVVVHGKGRREERLPLPAEVGEAVVGYLQRGRPRSDCRTVFLHTMAPVVGLTRQAVTQIVYSACDRAGVSRAGAHRLRHTLATDLLRSGASLTEIGQLLRHRTISTTSLYAKVDQNALATLARPWPGGAA